MQPKLFERNVDTADIEKVLLYALGDFQSRGKVLADRELAMDRLRGAFLRAFAKFGIDGVSDRSIAAGLRALGATVVEVPVFVAKHPFRVTVRPETAEMARIYYAAFAAKRPRRKHNGETRRELNAA